MDRDAETRLGRLRGYLAADADNPRLLAEVIDASLAAGERDEARVLIEHARRRHPADDAFVFRAATLAIAERRLEDAEQSLRQMGAQSLAHPAVRYNLAYIDVLRGRFDAAVEALDALERSGEASAEVDSLLVHALHHRGDLEGAKAAARRGLGRHPEDAQLLAVASLALWDAGDVEDARRLSIRALQLQPTALAALVTQGSIALTARDVDAARRSFGAALTANAADGRTWSGLGLASLLAQQFDRAAEELDTALRHMPEHIGTWHAMAWCEIVRQDLARAQHCFGRALALDRNFAESHGGLAVVAALAGRADEARALAQTAIRLDPNCISGRYAMAIADGEIRDAETFRAVAARLLAGQGDLVKVLARATRG